MKHAKSATLLERLAAGWQGIADSRAKSFLVAFLFAAILVLLSSVTWWHRNLNDDFAIANALSGRLMGEQGLSLFVNAALCQIIYALNVAYDSFNWFAVLELATVFLSYFTIAYIAIRHMPLRMAAAVIAFMGIYAMPICIVINNFTCVAFIAACAGCMVLTSSLIFERHAPTDIIWGIALIVIGSLWRFAMVLICIPLFGVVALAIALYKREEIGSAGKSILRLWPFIVAVIISLGLGAYDMAVWQQSPWSDWRTYNDARANLSDYPHKDYEEVKSDLKELGVSKNDYRLLFNWVSEDPEFYTTERLTKIFEVAGVSSLANKTPTGVLKDYAKRILSDRGFTLMVCFMFLFALFFLRGKNKALGIGVLMMGLIIAIAFHAVGRLPERVHYPVWLIAFSSVAMLAAYEWSLRSPEKQGDEFASSNTLLRVGEVALGVLAIALPFIAAAHIATLCHDHFVPERLTSTFATESFEPDNAFVDYVHEHPDNVFACQNMAHRELYYSHRMRAFYDDELQHRIIGIGGWASRSPFTDAKNEAVGMENPMKGLLDNENARFVSGSERVTKYVYQYLKEHYDKNAKCELVDTISGDNTYATLKVYRFSRG